MEAPNTYQFMRSATDHRTHVSICKKCLATVSDAPTESELDSKERDHVCTVPAKAPAPPE
jgi:hypothetical protein